MIHKTIIVWRLRNKTGADKTCSRVFREVTMTRNLFSVKFQIENILNIHTGSFTKYDNSFTNGDIFIFITLNYDVIDYTTSKMKVKGIKPIDKDD